MIKRKSISSLFLYYAEDNYQPRWGQISTDVAMRQRNIYPHVHLLRAYTSDRTRAKPSQDDQARDSRAWR